MKIQSTGSNRVNANKLVHSCGALGESWEHCWERPTERTELSAQIVGVLGE